jgi:hypothetical protein
MAVRDHRADEPSTEAVASAPADALAEPALLRDALSISTVLSLQRTAGNSAVTRLLARDPATEPVVAAPAHSKPVKDAATGSIRFTTPSAKVGDLLVHFTGSVAISGDAVLVGVALPKKISRKDANERLRAATEADVGAATPTGTNERIELAVAGEPIVLDLVAGLETAQPFVVVGRFLVKDRAVAFTDCEVPKAAVTIEAHAWISPAPKAAPATGGAAPPAAAISAASLKGFAYGGVEAVLGGGTTRIRTQDALAQVGRNFDELEARLGVKLPGAVKEYYGSPEQRVAWLQEMEHYFGSDAATLAHFAKIRPANIKGARTFVHEEAATRLEAVQAEIGEDKMPKSGGVGWPRRQCTLGGKQDLGSLHQLGFAIDFNAYGTPHLKDRRQLDLISVVTGRPAEMNLGPDHVSKINELDVTHGTSPEKQATLDALLKTASDEFKSLAAASEAFRGSLTTPAKDLGAELQELREQWYDKDSTEDDDVLMAKAQDAMKPWLDKVAGARAKTEGEIVAMKIDPATLPSGKALAAAQKAAPRQARKLAGVREKLSGTITKQLGRSARSAIAEVRKAIGEPRLDKPLEDAELVPEIERLEQLLAGITVAGPKKAWIDRLDAIADGLRNDPALVFGANRKAAKRKKGANRMRTVSDPGMAQLADTGWFSVKPNAINSEAFGEEFFLAMIKHGFNPLATSGNPDSMHFELRWKGRAM